MGVLLCCGGFEGCSFVTICVGGNLFGFIRMLGGLLCMLFRVLVVGCCRLLDLALYFVDCCMCLVWLVWGRCVTDGYCDMGSLLYIVRVLLGSAWQTDFVGGVGRDLCCVDFGVVYW